MCGIAGAVNWGDPATLSRMTDVQAHRGPDDRGIFETRTADGQWLGLGSRRLAILDLSPAGHMPMSTEDGRFTIAYNGEVYNYLELRGELEAAGVPFRSHTDTEVVLRLYERQGAECVRRLNGMFGFAIWDRDRDELFLARDHFGVKPVYYVEQPGRFAFASELKALLELPGFERKINHQALSQYLSFLWTPDPLTLLEGVRKLPAGHTARFRQGRLEVEQYWDLTYPERGHAFQQNGVELAAELRERFLGAVKSQLRSDVPLGAFLSAGLDSSGIVAAMARITGAPVHTYTISFPPSAAGSGIVMDDPAVARRTARQLGCDHTDIVVEPDVAALLPKLVWHLDEPIADPAAIMAYLVNREASKKLKVMLSGIGGDELFAGYRKHVAHFLAERYRKIPAPLRRLAIEPAIAALPSVGGTRWASYLRLMKKMARSGSLPPVERFIMDSIYLTEPQKRQLYAEGGGLETGGDPRCEHLARFSRVERADFLNQMLYLDTKVFMVSLNLTYNDKMSMANSVEARVPFLDRELAEWVAWNVPPSLKLHGKTTKHIFREAMRGLIPDEVMRQKKAGFGGPIDRWLAGELREMCDDLLGESRVRARGLFQPATIARWLAEHRSGRRDWSSQIWQLLTLELWMQTFLDRPGRAVA